jgi:hypothetical protein
MQGLFWQTSKLDLSTEQSVTYYIATAVMNLVTLKGTTKLDAEAVLANI